MPNSRKDKVAISRWLENQRGRPQYRPAPHVSRAMARVMRPLSKTYGVGHTGLAAHWDDIVGARFAKISKPVKFSGGKDGRTLIIRAPGPAAALIMAASQTIIDRVNGYLGDGHIRHIRVLQTRMKTESIRQAVPKGLTPRAQAKLQSGLENINDPDLKQALEGLGRKVIARPDR